MTILCRDSKVIYEPYIEIFFEWFNNVAGGQNGVNGWKPLLLSSCQDMSSHWKTLRKGNGSRNNSTYFCHCCAKENLNIALSSKSPCVNYCQPLDEQVCYHNDVLDNKKIEELKINRDFLQGRISYASTMKHIQDTSQLHLSEFDTNKFYDQNSIL